MVLFGLYAELVLMPAAQRSGFGTSRGLIGGFDRYPEQLQHALGFCMGVLDLIYEDVPGGVAPTVTDAT